MSMQSFHVVVGCEPAREQSQVVGYEIIGVGGFGNFYPVPKRRQVLFPRSVYFEIVGNSFMFHNYDSFQIVKLNTEVAHLAAITV